MKHQTTSLLKFKILHRRLGFRKVRETVGLLESLWMFCQHNAKRGDIGRFSDLELAIELEWDGDPEELIDALVESRWLDRCALNRLVVHDWEDHAPRWLKGVVSRTGGFAVPELRVDDSGSLTTSATQGPRLAELSDKAESEVSESTQGHELRVDDSESTTQGHGLRVADSTNTKPITSNEVTSITQAPAFTLATRSEPLLIFDSDVEAYRLDFPDVSVRKELAEMSDFLERTPSRRPNLGNARDFVSKWLSQHQAKASRKDAPATPKAKTAPDPVVARNCEIAGLVTLARRSGFDADWIEAEIHKRDREGLPIGTIQKSVRVAMKRDKTRRLEDGRGIASGTNNR